MHSTTYKIFILSIFYVRLLLVMRFAVWTCHCQHLLRHLGKNTAPMQKQHIRWDPKRWNLVFFPYVCPYYVEVNMYKWYFWLFIYLVTTHIWIYNNIERYTIMHLPIVWLSKRLEGKERRIMKRKWVIWLFFVVWLVK